jgi:hypothetical protein
MARIEKDVQCLDNTLAHTLQACAWLRLDAGGHGNLDVLRTDNLEPGTDNPPTV